MGEAVGSVVGVTDDGVADGSIVGLVVGNQDGSEVVRSEGRIFGLAVGSEGTRVGNAVADLVGVRDGLNVIREVGDTLRPREGDNGMDG